jgi:hypothetical protein
MVTRITGPDQPANLKAWLPYGVVVSNHSPDSLAGAGVMWSAEFEGRPLHRSAGVNGQWFHAPARQIKPGQSILVTPEGIVTGPRELKQYSDGRKLGNLPNFQRASRIEVAIEDVVLASGQFLGSDEFRDYEQLQAEIQAPIALASAILEKRTSLPISEILIWLRTLSAAGREGSLAQRDFPAEQQGAVARSMLSLYSNHGEAALYAMAQGILAEPVFPLHR